MFTSCSIVRGVFLLSIVIPLYGCVKLYMTVVFRFPLPLNTVMFNITVLIGVSTKNTQHKHNYIAITTTSIVTALTTHGSQ